MKYREDKMTNCNTLRDNLGVPLYRKLIFSILRSQSEISRNFDIPLGGSFISFAGDTLIWNLIGSNIDSDEISKFESRADKDDIKKYAVKNLRRSQMLNNLDLKKINIELGDEAIIEIYPEGNLRALRKEVNSKSFFSKLLFKLKSLLGLV